MQWGRNCKIVNGGSCRSRHCPLKLLLLLLPWFEDRRGTVYIPATRSHCTVHHRLRALEHGARTTSFFPDLLLVPFRKSLCGPYLGPLRALPTEGAFYFPDVSSSYVVHMFPLFSARLILAGGALPCSTVIPLMRLRPFLSFRLGLCAIASAYNCSSFPLLPYSFSYIYSGFSHIRG
jgi:hypothetical protein